MKRTIKPITLALIFALIVSSCAAQYGSGWLPEAEQATHDGYGAWVRVKPFFSKTIDEQYEGELIAVSKDSLYLINISSKNTFEAFPRQDIAKVVGNTYDRGGYWQYAVGAIVGCLLSATTGFYLFIPFFGYIISAIIGGSVASYISHISYDGDDMDWRELSTYARFPTGLPPTYNRANPKTKVFQGD